MRPVMHVDDRDKVVGSGTIESAIAKGLALRIVRLFIFDEAGELLLQQRSSSIKASPLKWDQSAGGHVDVGETYLQAAKRELAEELGIENVKLRHITKFYTEDAYGSAVRKRFNAMYDAVYDGPVRIDHVEVAGYKWIAPGELKQWLTRSPDDFTKGFPVALAHLGL